MNMENAWAVVVLCLFTAVLMLVVVYLFALRAGA